MQCKAYIRGEERCPNDTEEGFKYCEEHKTRRKAVDERIKAGVEGLGSAKTEPVYDLSNAQREFMESEDGSEPVTAEIVNEEKSKQLKPLVNETSHKTIVDQVNAMLERVVNFEFTAHNNMAAVPMDEWRYKDKSGAEQTRAEVAIYERAADRSLRALTQITKLGIEQQAAIIDKAQYEGVRTALHRTFVRMGYEQDEISKIMGILADEFSKLVR